MGRSRPALLISAAMFGVWGAAASMVPRTAGANTAPPAAPSFDRAVRPILQARCQPCHFSGGKVYDRFPFDSEDVVRRLGPARLFTRLKDEKDRAALRSFLKEKTAR